MPEKIDNLSIGMGRRHSMTMNKSFFFNVFIFFALFVKVVVHYATGKQTNLENVFFPNILDSIKIEGGDQNQNLK